MIYKFKKHRTKEDILDAINLLILFCRENSITLEQQYHDLDSTLEDLENQIRRSKK